MTTVNGLTNSTTSYVTLHSHANNDVTSLLSNKPGTMSSNSKYVQLQSVLPLGANSVASLSAGVTVPQAMSNAALAPTPGSTVLLNTGRNIPPGMVLTRMQNGQLMLVNANQILNNDSQQLPVPQINSIQPVVTPTVAASIATSSMLVSSVGNATTTPASVASIVNTTETKLSSTSVSSTSFSKDDIVNVNKCRNFLTTLIKLASTGGQPQKTILYVKTLVQNLIDDKISPDDFTKELQAELNSSPQPYLVPFLKRSLPLLRHVMMQQNHVSQVPAAVTQPIVHVSTSQTDNSTAPALPQHKTIPTVTKLGNKVSRCSIPDVHLSGVCSTGLPLKHPSLQAPPSGNTQPPFHIPHPSLVSSASSLSLTTMKTYPASSSGAGQRWNTLSSGGGTFKEEQDIKGLTSITGVQLSEQNARFLATNAEFVGTKRYQEGGVVNVTFLQKRMSEIASRNPNIQHIHADAIKYLSCAVECRLKYLLHKVAAVVCNRHVNYKEEDHYVASEDVKTQLKFLQELDRIEKQKHDEAERDILMRAIKSRSKNDNPEQLKLKERAKEMQQMELEKMQIRNADETARNAIGPRKKKARVDISISSSTGLMKSNASKSTTRSRTKRANLRDLMLVMEHEKETCRSRSLYMSYLK